MVVRKLVSVTCVVMMLAALGFAQGASTGDLHVTVKDPKGGLVTNANVAARDDAKGFERATATTPTASTTSRVAARTIHVTVQAPGFATAEVKNVDDYCRTAGGNCRWHSRLPEPRKP